jgi:replicative DNA helicase Mcm
VDNTDELIGQFREFFSRYYADEIAELAQEYPRDSRSLFVDYGDLYVFDAGIADDWMDRPEKFQAYAEQALRSYDLPADIELTHAHVRLVTLDQAQTYYPGSFSPQDRAGEYLAIEGQVAKATESYAKMIEAAFECERCGTTAHVSQTDEDSFQEPHECAGCERQGPFSINFDRSEFVDAQKLRVEEPPEVVQGGSASYIDVYVEDDIVGTATPGDKVTVYGTLHLQQEGNNRQKKNKFSPYLTGEGIELRDTEFEDIDITPEEREEIERLADNTDIYQEAIDSIAPGVHGYEEQKLALFFQLVGGVRATYPDGTTDRGDTHILMIGDPGTAKSTLMDAVEELAPRSVSVSGEGASKSGITAAAVRDDFGDNGEWTLEAGALVQANNGVACVDELDKVPEDVAESMHRAMAQQRIPVNKAGINTTLPAETAVLAAANPEHGRWSHDLEYHQQITLSSTLLSRFGLIWKFEDTPDQEEDFTIGEHITTSKEMAKRIERSDFDDDGEGSGIDPAIDHDLFRKYIAYAKSEVPDPVMASQDVRETMVSNFVSLRGANGYHDADAAVPVTFRKLEDVHRLAEAAARAELSETIEARHVTRAQELIGSSIREFGMNEDDEFDADIVETGTSKPQEQRIREMKELIAENQPSQGGLPKGKLTDIAEEEYGIGEATAERTLEQLLKKGEAYEPSSSAYRVFSG